MCCSGILNLKKTEIPDMDYKKPCIYLKGGCSIYKDRPSLCRRYKCTWLQGLISERFRPDKINALVNNTKKCVAIHYRGGLLPSLFIDELKEVADRGGIPLNLILHSEEGTKGKTIYEPKKRNSRHSGRLVQGQQFEPGVRSDNW